MANLKGTFKLWRKVVGFMTQIWVSAHYLRTPIL